MPGYKFDQHDPYSSAKYFLGKPEVIRLENDHGPSRNVHRPAKSMLVINDRNSFITAKFCFLPNESVIKVNILTANLLYRQTFGCTAT